MAKAKGIQAVLPYSPCPDCGADCLARIELGKDSECFDDTYHCRPHKKNPCKGPHFCAGHAGTYDREAEAKRIKARRARRVKDKARKTGKVSKSEEPGRKALIQ